jgi:hypothetical protein
MATGTGYISRPTLYGQVYPDEDVGWVSTTGFPAHKLDGTKINVGMGSAVDISFDTKLYFVGSKDFGGDFIGDNPAVGEEIIQLGRFDIVRYTPPGESNIISNVFSRPLYTLIGTKGSGAAGSAWPGYDYIKYPPVPGVGPFGGFRESYPSGELGASVKSNWDGTRVVVGDPGWAANRVHVLTTSGTVTDALDTRWASGTVTEAIIQGPTASEFGRSVAISKDAANIIVVGAPRLNKIYVYKAISSTNWQLVYENGDNGIYQKIRYDTNTYYDMIPESQGVSHESFNRYGYSVDITADGTRIVAGAPGNAVRFLHHSNCKFLPNTYAAETTTTSAVPHTYIDRGSRLANTMSLAVFGPFGRDNYLQSIATLGWVRAIESKNASWDPTVQTETFYSPGDALPDVYFSNTLTFTNFVGEDTYDHWFSNDGQVMTSDPSVTVEGENMYIGWAGNEYSNVNYISGGVHVYARSTPGDYSSGWSYVQFIKCPTPDSAATFGYGARYGSVGVVVSGDTMAISSPGWCSAWRNLGGYQIRNSSGISSSMSLDYASQPVLFGAADGDLAGESVVMLDSGEALGAVGSGATAAAVVGSPNGNSGTGCVDVYIWGEDPSTVITSAVYADKFNVYGSQYTAYGPPSPLLLNDTWQRVGTTITPPSDSYGLGNSEFGYSIAASGDGTRIAIGAPGIPGTYPYDGDGRYGGSVYIYDWNSSTSAWVLDTRIVSPNTSGYNKNGNGTNGRFGHSVSMSSDGNRVVVGVPHYGTSSSGLTTTGRVHVYERDTNNWTEMDGGVEYTLWGNNGDLACSVLDSSSIQPTAKFGRSVSMSSDGNRIAVGAPGYTWYESGNLANQNPEHGCALVYDWNGSTGVGKWHKGNSSLAEASIPHDTTTTHVAGGPSYGSNSGWSVSISGDGSRMVVGAPRYHAPNEQTLVRGCAAVYDIAGAATVPSTSMAGPGSNPIIYETDGSKQYELGRDVDISNDGNRIAVSGYFLNGETLTGNSVTSCGIVRTYHWSVEVDDRPPPVGTGSTPNGTFRWNRMGMKTRNNAGGGSFYDTSSTEQGIYTNSYYGKTISLSGTGHLLAVGCPGGYWSGNPTSAANGTTPGWVRVFNNSSNGSRYHFAYQGVYGGFENAGLEIGKVYIYKRVTVGSSTSRWKLVQGVELSQFGSNGPGSQYYNAEQFPYGEPAKTFGFNVRFGWDLALKDDHLVISSDTTRHGSTDPNQNWNITGQGQVYVFTRNTPGDRNSSWSWRRTLDPREGNLWRTAQSTSNSGGVTTRERFGYRVVIDGDSTNGYTIAASAPDRDIQPITGTGTLVRGGAVFIFKGSGDTWSTQGYFNGFDALLATDRQAGQNFGVTLSLDGNTLAIAAAEYSNSAVAQGIPTSGASYVFARSVDNVWIQTAKLEDETWFIGSELIVKDDTIYTLSRFPISLGTGALQIYHRHNPGELNSDWFLYKTIFPATFPHTGVGGVFEGVPGLQTNRSMGFTGYMYHANNSLYISVEGRRTGYNNSTNYVNGIMELRESDYYTRVSKESLGIPLIMGSELHGYTEDMFVGNEYNPTTGYSGHVPNDTAFDFTAMGTCVRISPDGARIIAGSPRYSLDGTTLATHVGKIESWEWQEDLNAESTVNTIDEPVIQGFWNKYPSAIVGSSAGGRMGESFNLDYQGDRLAVLIKHPPRLVNENNNLRSGYTVQPIPHAGSLHVFDWSGTNWFEATEEIFFPNQNPFTGPIDGHPTLDPINTSNVMQFTVPDDSVNDHFGDVAICSGDVVISGCVNWTSSTVDNIQKYVGPPGAVESHFFTLAQNVRGNTVIGGSLSSDIVYVGTNDGSTNTSTADEKRISFGGTYASDNTYDSASIQNRIIYYDPNNRDPDQQGFSELLISKRFSNSITNEGAVDQVRIKAAEFHLDEYISSDTLLEQKPALTKNALGDFKINPEFIMPHESATANIKAKLDVEGDTFIRRRLNAGYYPGNQLKGIEKLPWRIFFDTRNREIVKKITLTSYLFTGDSLVSNVVTQRVSPGGDWGRHDTIGNIYWECSHDSSGGFLTLSNVTSSVSTTGFNGMANSDVKSADNKYVTKFSLWLQIPELHSSSTYQYVHTLAERSALDISPTHNPAVATHPPNPSYSNGKVIKIKMAGSSPPSPIPAYSLLIEVPGTLGSWRVAGTLDSIIPTAQTGAFGSGSIDGFKQNTWYHVYAEINSSYALEDQVIKVNNQVLPLSLLSGSVSPYDAPGLAGIYDTIGSRIPGPLSFDYFGTATDISDTGEWLVAGGDANGRPSLGKVGVYKFTPNGWKLQGNSVLGTSNGDMFGTSVAVSNPIPLVNDSGIVYPNLAHYPRFVVGTPKSDVNGVNSGSVKMFGWPSPNWSGVTDDWVQIGSTLTGSAADSLFGSQVDISNDGRYVAVASRQGIHIYNWGGGAWTINGQTFYAHTSSGNWYGGGGILLTVTPSGTEPPRLKFSDQGDYLIGSRPVGTGSTVGEITVWQKANFWKATSGTTGAVQYGNKISVSGSFFGHCVDISSDGQTVAFSVSRVNFVGAPVKDVRVYTYNAGTWSQKGATLTGVGALYESFGVGGDTAQTTGNRRQVALSGDGNRLVVGSPAYLDGSRGVVPNHQGAVYVFNYISGAWVLDNVTSTPPVGTHPGGSVTLVSSDFTTSTPQSLSFGSSVAISKNGNRIVVGEKSSSFGGYDSGAVTVYSPDKNIQHWIGDSRFSVGSYLDAETPTGIKMGNFAFETYNPFLESPSWTDPTTNIPVVCAHPTCQDLYEHGSPSEKLVSGGDLRILNNMYIGQNTTDGQLTTQNNPGIVPVFYVDNLSNRVGVNIDFPQESLHVVGNILATRKPNETSTYVKVFSEESTVSSPNSNESGFQIEAHSASGGRGIFKMFMTDDNQDVLNFVNDLYPATQPITIWRNAVAINMNPTTARAGYWVNPSSAMASGYVLRVDGGVEINVPAGQVKIDNYGVKFGTVNSNAYFGFGDANSAGWSTNSSSFTFMSPVLVNSAGNINAANNISCRRIFANYSGSQISGFVAHTSHPYSHYAHTHSDDRIKYNETPITDNLALINKLVPKRYEKISKIPEGAVGTWIPTDEEWENVKAPEPDGGPINIDPEFKIQPIKDWHYEDGFIAQELLADPVTRHLVKGVEEQVLTEYLFEESYDRLSDEEKSEWTIVPDDERKDYWEEDEVHYQKKKLTQTPLKVHMNAINVASVGAIQELSGIIDAEKAYVQELKNDLDTEKTKNIELSNRIYVVEQLYQGLLERVVQLESS